MVIEERITEIFRISRTEQNKFIYFLIALAASTIAFGVTQTRDVEPSWTLIPLAMSGFALALSVLLGMVTLRSIDAALSANYQTLVVESERRNHERSDESAAAITQVVEEQSRVYKKRATRLSRYQIFLLIAGFVLFMLWHALDIYARSYGQSSV